MTTTAVAAAARPPAANQLHRIKLSKGETGGLGMKVDKENAVIGVTAGAAERAGVRVGDVVWEVDGCSSAGERLAQVIDSSRSSHALKVAYMKGAEGRRSKCG